MCPAPSRGPRAAASPVSLAARNARADYTTPTRSSGPFALCVHDKIVAHLAIPVRRVQHQGSLPVGEPASCAFPRVPASVSRDKIRAATSPPTLAAYSLGMPARAGTRDAGCCILPAPQRPLRLRAVRSYATSSPFRPAVTVPARQDPRVHVRARRRRQPSLRGIARMGAAPPPLPSPSARVRGRVVADTLAGRRHSPPPREGEEVAAQRFLRPRICPRIPPSRSPARVLIGGRAQEGYNVHGGCRVGARGRGRRIASTASRFASYPIGVRARITWRCIVPSRAPDLRARRGCTHTVESECLRRLDSSVGSQQLRLRPRSRAGGTAPSRGRGGMRVQHVESKLRAGACEGSISRIWWAGRCGSYGEVVYGGRESDTVHGIGGHGGKPASCGGANANVDELGNRVGTRAMTGDAGMTIRTGLVRRARAASSNWSAVSDGRQRWVARMSLKARGWRRVKIGVFGLVPYTIKARDLSGTPARGRQTGSKIEH
ncbi:hypothetical protein B0H17DRAFT_1131693 [Mycena rosella]|uniref:Uncharacterized protein n=1 Tax=Mycena rosella TaxID=1033263 RepID=A0AAD7DMC6_MYCRO|nr:hypothetical protein B0H17DRAFT_1131693 [Mycena rosella]